jgi:hypothetical protein
MLLLWFTLRKYAYPHTRYTYFSGQKVMMAIAGGMVAGLIFSMLYRFFLPFLLVNAVFMAVFEEILRLVILNSPWFQMKFDSVFYGAALGGGTATMIISGIAYTTQYMPETSGDFWTPVMLTQLVILSVSLCLLNMANGAMIGYGCGKGVIWTYTFQAIIAHVIFSIALIGVIYPYPEQVGIFYYPSLAGILLVGVLLYIYVYRNMVENALPENLRKQRRREMLQMAREGRKQ